MAHPSTATTTVWGGKLCSFVTLDTIRTDRHGLCRLCRDQIGTVVTWYIRFGIRQDGVAAGGAQKYTRLRDAQAAWDDILEEA